MTAVQLQHRTMLLSDSCQVQSLGSSGLNYRGSDADYDEDAR